MTDEAVKTISIEPHWPGFARWMAHGFVTKSFPYSAAKVQMRSFLETIRFMALTQPDELEKIINEYPKGDDD